MTTLHIHLVLPGLMAEGTITVPAPEEPGTTRRIDLGALMNWLESIVVAMGSGEVTRIPQWSPKP